MEDGRPLGTPLMRVAPMFYKEKTFWDTRLTHDEQFRDIGSVDHIDHNPHDLDELLVTSLARISMYDSNTLELQRTYKTNTQFQVYGGCFRGNDGRLIAVGSEEGKVFVFESQNTNPLRTVELKAPTRRVLFKDNKLVTFSDDLTVRILDVGSGEPIRAYGPTPKSNRIEQSYFHKDYVRCGCLVDQLIVSGSYDNMVKFWDPRVDELRPVMEYDHGHSVESFCPREPTLLMSVGGNKLHVFDMIAGKTLTSIIPKHHKTITCVANYDNKYLLTGALDGYLNVIDFNYEYITRFNYDEAQILSLAINQKLIAVGFNNHNVHVKRFKDYIRKSNNEMAELEKLQSGYFGPNMATRFFQGMGSIKPKMTPVVLNDVAGLHQAVVIKPSASRQPKQPMYKNFLMSFQHTKALDYACANYKNDIDGVPYVLRELIKRDKLTVAMTNCKKVVTLMRVMSKLMNDARHNRIILDSASILISLMLSNRSLIKMKEHEFWLTAQLLVESTNKELELVDSCTSTGAQLETVLVAMTK